MHLRFRVALSALVLLGVSLSPLHAQDAEQELQTIELELKREYKELRATSRDVGGDEAVAALYREFERDVLPLFAERYAKIARAQKGQPIALQAWMAVLELAQQGLTGAPALEAMNALVTDFASSEELDAVAMTLRYSTSSLGEEPVAKALTTMAERTPHRTVKAAALFNLGALLGEDRPAGDPKLSEAKAVFAKLAEFKDVELYEGRSYADAAASFVFALENLVVGKACPDFGAVDAEGASFKLSDYKGKVVLVDFWGFW